MNLLVDPLRRLVEQPLQLVGADDGYELRDASAEHLLGSLDGVRGAARAEAGGAIWALDVERTRRSWQLVARTEDGEPVACYHPNKLSGGQIWVAPDTWGRLRPTYVRVDLSWGLDIAGNELLRVWTDPRTPEGICEIVVGPACVEHPELPLVLIPFLCWTALAEQSAVGPMDTW